MKTYKTLIELFEKKSRWTKQAFAYDKGGWPVDPTSRLANRWCLVGGVRKVYGYGDKAQRVMERIRKQLHPIIEPSLTGFNDRDDTSYEDVYRIVKAARV